jgi:hypothetical protein
MYEGDRVRDQQRTTANNQSYHVSIGDFAVVYFCNHSRFDVVQQTDDRNQSRACARKSVRDCVAWLARYAIPAQHYTALDTSYKATTEKRIICENRSNPILCFALQFRAEFECLLGLDIVIETGNRWSIDGDLAIL